MDTSTNTPVTPPEAETIDLGDVAELTEGAGRARAEGKRQPYN